MPLRTLPRLPPLPSWPWTQEPHSAQFRPCLRCSVDIIISSTASWMASDQCGKKPSASDPISCCYSWRLLDGSGPYSTPHLAWGSLDRWQKLLLSPTQSYWSLALLYPTSKSMACARATLTAQTDTAATPGRIHLTSQPSVTLLPNS